MFNRTALLLLMLVGTRDTHAFAAGTVGSADIQIPVPASQCVPEMSCDEPITYRDSYRNPHHFEPDTCFECQGRTLTCLSSFFNAPGYSPTSPVVSDEAQVYCIPQMACASKITTLCHSSHRFSEPGTCSYYCEGQKVF